MINLSKYISISILKSPVRGYPNKGSSWHLYVEDENGLSSTASRLGIARATRHLLYGTGLVGMVLPIESQEYLERNPQIRSSIVAHDLF